TVASLPAPILAWTDGRTAWLTHEGMALGPCTVALVNADSARSPAPSYRDAYEGAREDLLDWKGRAQRAEARLRSLGWAGIDASEPPTPSAPVVDDSTFSEIEDALDRLNAPARAADGRWLKLTERISALSGVSAPVGVEGWNIIPFTGS